MKLVIEVPHSFAIGDLELVIKFPELTERERLEYQSCSPVAKALVEKTYKQKSVKAREFISKPVPIDKPDIIRERSKATEAYSTDKAWVESRDKKRLERNRRAREKRCRESVKSLG